MGRRVIALTILVSTFINFFLSYLNYIKTPMKDETLIRKEKVYTRFLAAVGLDHKLWNHVYKFIVTHNITFFNENEVRIHFPQL